MTSTVTGSDGFIFNIQKYSVHDGPGIRTTVFLKGCPLRCSWCSNPESQRHTPELGYNISRCLHCGRCAAACPEKALGLPLPEKSVHIDRQACRACAILRKQEPPCVAACPAQALARYGGAVHVREVLEEVERDAVFYARSGGGMTLSGGEPFAQGDFALALLRGARKRYIHRAVETCGAADEALFLEGCGLCDYLLFDIKHMDSATHKTATGMGNERIVRNIRNVRAAYPQLHIHIRTPLVPGFNDTEETVRNIAVFARELGAQEYEVLPYHRMGLQKYGYLGREYPLGGALLDNSAADELTRVALQTFQDAQGHCPQKNHPA